MLEATAMTLIAIGIAGLLFLWVRVCQFLLDYSKILGTVVLFAPLVVLTWLMFFVIV